MAITIPRRGNRPTTVIPTDPKNPASMPPGNPGRRKRHQRFVSRGGVVAPAPKKKS